MARQLVLASSQYLTLNNAVWANAFPVTLSIWFLPNTLGNRIVFGLFDTTKTTFPAVRMQQRTSINVIRAEHRDSVTAAQAQTTATYNTSAWNNFGGSYSANNNRTVYLNGGNSIPDTQSAAIAMTTNKVLIGAGENNSIVSSWVDGRVSHAAIHDVALNADEMGAIGKGVNPFRVRTSNVLAYWPIGHGSPDPNLAKQGGTLNMTVQNSPAIADSAPVSPLFF
jgi:hypothetical protein